MYIKGDSYLYHIIQFFLNNFDNFIELTGFRDIKFPKDSNGKVKLFILF